MPSSDHVSSAKSSSAKLSGSNEQAMENYMTDLFGIGEPADEDTQLEPPKDKAESVAFTEAIGLDEKVLDEKALNKKTFGDKAAEALSEPSALAAHQKANPQPIKVFPDKVPPEKGLAKKSVIREKPQKSTGAKPKQKHLFAEQIPADAELNVDQKKGLQKLLDASINLPTLPHLTPNITQPEKANKPVLDKAAVAPTVEIETKAVTTSEIKRPEINRSEASPVPDAAIIKDNIVDKPPISSDINSNESNLSDLGPQPVSANTLESDALNYRGHWQGNLPEWGQGSFDVLLFRSHGVTMAIPLIALGHIYLQTEPLNQLPSLPPWVTGIKPLPEMQLRVIDTGAYFMPERKGKPLDDKFASKGGSLSKEAGEMPILSIANSHWAFAVDTVANPVTINPSDVQWRSLNTDNPWLAGAVKEHMCVLIDTPALLLQLNNS